MSKSRGRTSTDVRSTRFHLDATPTRHAGLFHHGGSLSSADSGSLNHFSHPTSPLLTGTGSRDRTGTSRRSGRPLPVASSVMNTVVNEHGVVTLQINDSDADQPVYQVFNLYGFCRGRGSSDGKAS